MKRALIILRGLPGNGKTTLAEILATEYGISNPGGSIDTSSTPWPCHSADDYFYENGPNPGKYDFNRDKLGAAHKQCQDRTESDLRKGKMKVFVANTFTTDKEIKPYKELAEKYGYLFISLVVENRHNHESIHNVPKETMDAMESRFSIKLRSSR